MSGTAKVALAALLASMAPCAAAGLDLPAERTIDLDGAVKMALVLVPAAARLSPGVR